MLKFIIAAVAALGITAVAHAKPAVEIGQIVGIGVVCKNAEAVAELLAAPNGPAFHEAIKRKVNANICVQFPGPVPAKVVAYHAEMDTDIGKMHIIELQSAAGETGYAAAPDVDAAPAEPSL